MNAPAREQWKSRLGFILATSGASIGLGNIQRFPYLTAKFGGGLFVVIYLLSVAFLGIPLILNEFALGRHSKKTPFLALKAIKEKGVWKYLGLLGILVAFFILSYYTVIAGWTLGFVFSLATGSLPDINSFSADPIKVIGCMSLTLFLTVLLVQGGLQKGIEKWSKILMPLLLVILLLLLARSLFLPNSLQGLAYFLTPDWSQFSPKILLYALSQAFFSLCVGEAVLMTYGSYASKSENLVGSALSVAFFDTLVAMLAGLIVFPALFYVGKGFEPGAGLIFQVIPQIFIDLPGGYLIGGTFFLMLFFAAFTTCIALLEMPVAFLCESTSWSRKKSTWIVGLCALVIGLPSALSKGASPFLSSLSLPLIDAVGFYDIMDFIWGGLGMIIGGLGLAIFTGWVWGSENAIAELSKGCPSFQKIGFLWSLIVKYLAPVVILGILINMWM